MSDVTGTRRAFAGSARTTCPGRVWELWTDPASWGTWDLGLSSASLDRPFAPGAGGELEDTRGRVSPFVVERVEAGRSCRVRVRLPAAALVLHRTLEPATVAGEPTRLTHAVRFEGPLGLVFAGLLGGRFRRLLPPTLEALVALAEGTRR